MAEIEFRNVTKSFGAVQVIKGVDLKIEKGEFMVFVGPSGCGKSTMLRLISGLESITSGDHAPGRVRDRLGAFKPEVGLPKILDGLRELPLQRLD